jgi:cytochrome c oxidase cbb3-type subunit III
MATRPALVKPTFILAALLVMNALPSAGQIEQAPESEPRPIAIDPALVSSGKQIFASNCSFCHGAEARGGAQGGPDLTQSSLVKADENGKQLGAFLKVGRPDKGMPAFNLADEKVRAIAAFLHSAIQSTPRRHSLGTEVLVGDAAAGKAFFNGEGHCAKCHSGEGDLKGIGSKYPPAILQGRLVLPIGHGGYPGLSPSEPPRIRVTVTEPQGKTLSGLLVFLSDYAVTLVDSSGERHTLPRHGNVPKIVMEDPLQAHLDRQSNLTDRQMHDLTAYLATLK